MPDFRAMMAGAKGEPPPKPETSGLPPGVAMLFKSVGLDKYVGKINEIVESGALDQILTFANQIGPIRAELAAIRSDLAIIRTALEPGSDTGGDRSDLADGSTGIRAIGDGREREPGSVGERPSDDS